MSDDALSCSRCGEELARVRCGACFHRNHPDHALCVACGAPLGLEPVGETESLRCSHCGLPFLAFRGGSGTLHDCGQCGGQLVDHGLLHELLARREAYGTRAPRRIVRQNPLDQPVVYVACPVCKNLMLRRNFGGQSGIIVDVCAVHGVWFDRGELPRVLEFVERGGLELERRRKAEEEHEKRTHFELTGGNQLPHFLPTQVPSDPLGRTVAVLDVLGTALSATTAHVASMLRSRKEKP